MSMTCQSQLYNARHAHVQRKPGPLPVQAGLLHKANCVGTSKVTSPSILQHRLPVSQRTPAHARSNCCRCQASGEAAAPSVQTEQSQGFRWCSGVGAGGNVVDAVDAACRQAEAQLGSSIEPQIAVVFCSSYYAAEYKQLLPAMRKRYPSLQRIVGSSGAGVIGTGKAGPQELEDEPAVSVTLGCLPQVNTSSFHVTEGSLPDADSSPAEWQALSGVEIDSPGNTSFVVMSNPQFGGIVDLLAGLDFAFPEATKIGGLSSSHNMGAPTATFSWSSRQKADEPEHGVLQTGAVVLVLQGNLVMEPIIAQGCQALSDRIWAIDKMAHNNMLLELTSVSGKRTSCTALKALQMDIEGLPPAARASAGANLTMSVAPDDFKDTSKLDAADFLVRGLLGADPRSGSIAIGESVRLGQRVRFMQRGREGAMQDLQNMGLAYKRRQLQASMEGKSGPAPFGALMFTCNGRGRNLYKEADYDSRTLTSFIPVPVSGFFCNGEIGQVGKSTYLHGFTCAAAILRPAPPDNHA